MRKIFLLLVLLIIVFIGVRAWTSNQRVDRTWLQRQNDYWMADPEIEGGKLTLSDAEWKKRLTPEQYYVLREHGTERAFTGKYHDSKAKGIYICAACHLPLFNSEDKYDSGTGWPSFWQPINPKNVAYHEDWHLLTPRIEVSCRRCGSHLGHVFDDGPQPTGKRYCMNSIALDFVPQDKPLPPLVK